jgi:hypothetical protein
MCRALRPSIRRSRLHFAGSLVGLTFSFQFLVAENLPCGFLNGSLGLLCRTFDSIFIHYRILAVCHCRSKVTAAST